MIKGLEGGTASWSRRRGNEVDGDVGSRVKIGVGEAVDSDKGNREARPRGMSRRISTSASSVNFLSADMSCMTRAWKAYRSIHNTSLIDPRPHSRSRYNILDRFECTRRPKTQLDISIYTTLWMIEHTGVPCPVAQLL